MLLTLLLLIPLLGLLTISIGMSYELSSLTIKRIKRIALTTSIINLFISLIVFVLFDFSSNHFQFVQQHEEVGYFDFYSGLDGLSIYFVMLTTIITPIALLSNWNSIKSNVSFYVVIILLLETLLLAVFLVLDILLFYVFFESILPPLFILIGLFGSTDRVRASFYLFLYTLEIQCKRAKLRGNPKALITKDKTETSYPASLMIEGIVISLKILAIEMGDRGSKSRIKKVILVKEQRVDGSSIMYIIVRCILVTGKAGL